jgi:hypothetical protein
VRELVVFQVRVSEDSTDGTVAMKEVKIEVTWKVLKKE